MKKILLLIVFLSLLVVPAMAEDVESISQTKVSLSKFGKGTTINVLCIKGYIVIAGNHASRHQLIQMWEDKDGTALPMKCEN